MRDTLEEWVSDAESLTYFDQFGLGATPTTLTRARERQDDYYISLVGELFRRIEAPFDDRMDWSRLANALAQYGITELTQGNGTQAESALPRDVSLFAATAFYLGGFPASAYVTLRAGNLAELTDGHRAAYELLVRPTAIESRRVRGLVGAVRRGDVNAIGAERERATEQSRAALALGPETWVGWRLFGALVAKFATTNLRAVLPVEADGFWDPLVASFLGRTPPVWDFFPSQIDAIQAGLVTRSETFSLQMPTGAGKTALAETVLYHHLRKHPTDAAVLLVPYRALASELRGSLVRRLNSLGLNARSAYGGTVPSGDEVHELADNRALVATPETLSGLLSADLEFFHRISLVVCDEGHLLDGGARGVSLELLLARLRAMEPSPPRFVFISAIVPNIDEINDWLGGSDETVVRSDYRPALAEFARLDVAGAGSNLSVGLRFHPHESGSFEVERFLSEDDFRYRNPATGRLRTYPFTTYKTQAVAAARKLLPMGSVAVFAANKRGRQGTVGLAEELIAQLDSPLSLPLPIQFARDQAALQEAVEYLSLEYGTDWVGTRLLAQGAVLHHGDVPQEAREVVQRLLSSGAAGLVFCTNTLAEGVNLPIRTIVLYSVQRRLPDGHAENLLARDIRNLVGRAGRAGSTTKGLVVCANAGQWSLIEPVALGTPGERVDGALLDLMQQLQAALLRSGLEVSNELLERSNYVALETLVDGVDATLIDLAAEEIGDDELAHLASNLVDETFAARQAPRTTIALMRQVFELRARRIAGFREAGQLAWIRETGTRARMLSAVEERLLNARPEWDDISDPIDSGMVATLLEWAWELPEVQRSLRNAYRGPAPERGNFQPLLERWLQGQTLGQTAAQTAVPIDDLMAIHATVIAYELQTAFEQGIALLKKFCESRNQAIAAAVVDFPEHVRFGVPNRAARFLAGTVRHRRAAVALGTSAEIHDLDDRDLVVTTAQALIEDTARWIPLLGRLVLNDTVEDLTE